MTDVSRILIDDHDFVIRRSEIHEPVPIADALCRVFVNKYAMNLEYVLFKGRFCMLHYKGNNEYTIGNIFNAPSVYGDHTLTNRVIRIKSGVGNIGLDNLSLPSDDDSVPYAERISIIDD